NARHWRRSLTIAAPRCLEDHSVYPLLQSRDDILNMLDEMTEARKSILERVGKLTDAMRNDPVYPGTWSVLQNLAHLAWAEAYMLAWIGKRPAALPKEEQPSKVPPEVPAIKTALDEAHAAAIAFLKANPESVLAEHCQYGWRGEETVGGVF